VLFRSENPRPTRDYGGWGTHLMHVFSFTAIVAVCFSLLAAQEIKKSAIVTLEVVDPTGAPIPKARTEFVSVETARAKSSVADDTGRVQIELGQGSYDVIVSSQGFKTTNQQVHVNGDARQKFAVALRVAGCPTTDPCPVLPDDTPPRGEEIVKVTMVAVDGTGAVIPGVQIRMAPRLANIPEDLKTNDRGEVVVELRADNYFLWAAAPSFEPIFKQVQVEKVAMQTVRLQLQAAKASNIVHMGGPNYPVPINAVAAKPPVASVFVSMKVTDMIGAPVSYAQFSGFPLKTEWNYPEVDEQGELAFKMMPGSYDVVVSSPGFQRWTKHIELQDGEDRMVRVLLKREQR
jgi:hypothetical protein